MFLPVTCFILRILMPYYCMVMGEGKHPTVSHLVKLGLGAGLSKKLIDEAIEQIKHVLDRWKYLSKDYNVAKENIDLVAKAINNTK